MSITLSAGELLVAAALCKKAKLYAIADEFAGLPPAQRSAAIQKTKDGLWEKRLLSMDFDGNTTLDGEVRQAILFCTECSKYLSVVSRSRDAGMSRLIVWKRGDRFLLADVRNKTYRLSVLRRGEVEKRLLHSIPWSGKSRPEKTTKLTQTALKKAKRCAKSNDPGAAALLLRRQGADEDASRIIANALLENTSVFSVVTVDQTVQPPVCGHCMFSVDGEGYLLIEPAMEDYRSAAAFADIPEQRLKERLFALLDGFFSGGGAADEA